MTLAPTLRAALWLACAAAVTAHAAPPQAGASAPASAALALPAPALALPAAAALALPAAATLAVPATRYRPVLPYRPAPAPATSPDQNWKALNDTVGSYNSMSLTMGGMDGAGAQDEPAQPGPPAGAAPSAQVAAPATAPSPHDHHHAEASQ
jgi:hypothetical protein